ncbi:MAG: ABC transporter permease subunit [Tissierella sp.]|nr:ABC transporter permease subunit [Tissierella sp.]
MLELIKTEFFKMRRSGIWIPIVFIPMVSVLFGSGNYYLNREILQSQWYSLWTQVSLFYGLFFYAITIAIAASYSWRMEHKDNNWNRILALPYDYSQIIISKLISISIVSLCIQFTLLIFYYLVGEFVFQFQLDFPREVIIWGVVSWIVSISICALQSFISMKIKSFSVPVGISFCLCFIGLGFYAFKGLGENLTYFSPNSLLITSMPSNKAETFEVLEYFKMIISGLGFTIFFTCLSIMSIKKQKV